MDRIGIGILLLHGQRDSLRELRESKKMADLQSEGFNVVGKSLLYYGEEQRTYNEAREKCRHGCRRGCGCAEMSICHDFRSVVGTLLFVHQILEAQFRLISHTTLNCRT